MFQVQLISYLEMNPEGFVHIILILRESWILHAPTNSL